MAGVTPSSFNSHSSKGWNETHRTQTDEHLLSILSTPTPANAGMKLWSTPPASRWSRSTFNSHSSKGWNETAQTRWARAKIVTPFTPHPSKGVKGNVVNAGRTALRNNNFQIPVQQRLE